MSETTIVGVFEREDDCINAAEAARTAGLHIVDAFGPHASHGLDRALGLRPSRLPVLCFLLGLIGATGMSLFQYWASAVSWPINVGGKPWNSWPAFVPATFEMMVLCAGVGTVAAFLWSARLRPGRISALRELGVTDDRFALVVRAVQHGSDRARIEQLLSQHHASSVEARSVQ
jgi:hypothetical protein